MADDLFKKATDFLKDNRPWYSLPKLLAVPKLIQMRNDLRQKNLHDTEEPPMPLRAPSDPIPPEVLTSRTYEGTWNDLGCPHMGAAGRRLGRNFPLEHTHPDTANLMNPNPRDVSLKLLTRDRIPAGHDPEPAGRGLDSVHGPRLVRAQDFPNGNAGCAARRSGPVARSPDENPCYGARSRARWIDAPAGLCEPKQPLVGWFADLRR